MVRALTAGLAIIALTFLTGSWLPWWTLALLAAVICFLLGIRPGIGFLTGFIAGLLLWSGMALWIDQANASLLSQQIGQLFNGLSTVGILLITGIFGALTGGLGGWTGSSLRALFTPAS